MVHILQRSDSSAARLVPAYRFEAGIQRACSVAGGRLEGILATLWNNPQGEESVFEQILSRFKGPRPSSHARTLTTVATISFFMTGI